MSWFLTHLWQPASLSHVRSGCYLRLCVHALLQKRFPRHEAQNSCKASDAGKSPVPLQQLALCPTDVSLRGMNEIYSSVGPKGADALGTEELIYCSLSTTVLLVSLALVGKLLKVSEWSPRGCSLCLIGGGRCGS